MGWVVWVTKFLKTLVSCDSKLENMILDQIGDLQAKYRAPWVTSSGLFPKKSYWKTKDVIYTGIKNAMQDLKYKFN